MKISPLFNREPVIWIQSNCIVEKIKFEEEGAWSRLTLKQPASRIQALNNGTLTSTQKNLRLGGSEERVFQQLHGVFPLERLSINSCRDAMPVVGNLADQEACLGECFPNFSELMNLRAKLRDTGRHFERLSVVTIGDGLHHLEIVYLDGSGQYPYINAPCTNGSEQLHCDPTGSPLHFPTAPPSLERRKREGANDSTNRANCSPSIPPDHASIGSKIGALTYSIEPTHSLIPLWTGRHSAMTRQPEACRA